MSTHDDVFVLEDRIAAFQNGQYIGVRSKRLVVTAFYRSRQAILFQQLHDVQSGGPAASASRLAPFKRIVGEGRHMLPKLARSNRIERGGKICNFRTTDRRAEKDDR
jgi:hypothetical protein